MAFIEIISNIIQGAINIFLVGFLGVLHYGSFFPNQHHYYYYFEDASRGFYLYVKCNLWNLFLVICKQLVGAADKEKKTRRRRRARRRDNKWEEEATNHDELKTTTKRLKEFRRVESGDVIVLEPQYGKLEDVLLDDYDEDTLYPRAAAGGVVPPKLYAESTKQQQEATKTKKKNATPKQQRNRRRRRYNKNKKETIKVHAESSVSSELGRDDLPDALVQIAPPTRNGSNDNNANNNNITSANLTKKQKKDKITKQKNAKPNRQRNRPRRYNNKKIIGRSNPSVPSDIGNLPEARNTSLVPIAPRSNDSNKTNKTSANRAKQEEDKKTKEKKANEPRGARVKLEPKDDEETRSEAGKKNWSFDDIRNYQLKRALMALDFFEGDFLSVRTESESEVAGSSGRYHDDHEIPFPCAFVAIVQSEPDVEDEGLVHHDIGLEPKEEEEGSVHFDDVGERDSRSWDDNDHENKNFEFALVSIDDSAFKPTKRDASEEIELQNRARGIHAPSQVETIDDLLTALPPEAGIPLSSQEVQKLLNDDETATSTSQNVGVHVNDNPQYAAPQKYRGLGTTSNEDSTTTRAIGLCSQEEGSRPSKNGKRNSTNRPNKYKKAPKIKVLKSLLEEVQRGCPEAMKATESIREALRGARRKAKKAQKARDIQVDAVGQTVEQKGHKRGSRGQGTYKCHQCGKPKGAQHECQFLLVPVQALVKLFVRVQDTTNNGALAEEIGNTLDKYRHLAPEVGNTLDQYRYRAPEIEF